MLILFTFERMVKMPQAVDVSNLWGVGGLYGQKACL